MKLWTGTSGFQYPEWKGKFYPDDLPLSKMLAFYASQLATTEINYTFRSLPSEKTITRWREGTPADFRFALKAPQKITHFSRLRNCMESLSTFAQATEGLGEKRGPVLFQLPPTVKKDASLLREFLRIMPEGMRAAFEFRHDSWFDDETFAVLKTGKAALCIADTEDLKSPLVATANFGYLRLRGGAYTAADIGKWAKYLRGQSVGWSDAFVYFMHEDTCSGPVFAKKLARKMLA